MSDVHIRIQVFAQLTILGPAVIVHIKTVRASKNISHKASQQVSRSERTVCRGFGVGLEGRGLKRESEPLL